MSNDNQQLIERLKKKRVRVCYSMHECCLCLGKISNGQAYFDGGYGRRAHAKCADPKNWGASET